jgi:hypothetical protein
MLNTSPEFDFQAKTMDFAIPPALLMIRGVSFPPRLDWQRK